MGIRKDSIQTAIDTNLASGKTPKISPADHREVAQGIVNFIDNRIVTNTQGAIFAGSHQFQTGGVSDIKVTIPLGTTINNSDSDYIVVGCLTSTTTASENCRYFYTIRNRTTTQFDLLLRAINPASANLTFEYLLYTKEEVQ